MIVNDGENLSRNCYLIKYKGSIFVVFFLKLFYGK